MRTLLIILILCWPFGNRRRVAPIQPQQQRASGHWQHCPHWEDGYWVKAQWKIVTDEKDEYWREVYRRRIEGYPFQLYEWTWPGKRDGDETLWIEWPKHETPKKPPKSQWIPDYDPFAPGQKYNL